MHKFITGLQLLIATTWFTTMSYIGARISILLGLFVLSFAILWLYLFYKIINKKEKRK